MSADPMRRDEPKKVLQEMEVHDQWIGHFRSSENDAFYNLAFDLIATRFGAADEHPAADAGCGTGTKTIHLAKRGYRVIGMDISDAILGQARQSLDKLGLGSNVELRREDLTRISLQPGSVRRAICWGVLMHIPAVEDAVAELARIVAPGGVLIVSEGNQHSMQAMALRWLKKALGRERARIQHSPAGIEIWEETSSGLFMTRQANIPWLIREFERHGLTLQERRAGQFTEIYTLLPWKFARGIVHAMNNFWFRFIRFGGPAFGNLLVFRKPAAG